MHAFPDIDRLKVILDQHRPLDPVIVRNLREDLIVRWTYHSNAMEGNTLTLRETKVALEGITVEGKSIREHLEAMNHRDAILVLEDIVQQTEPLSEGTIKSLHQLILRGIDDENAGRYQKGHARKAGAYHLPPGQVWVPKLMERFIKWHRTEAAVLHPVERAARVHSDFVKIHPFPKGNGRIARLLMNLELLKAGYPAAVLPVESRLAYFGTLDADHVDDITEAFVQLIAEIVRDSFKPYWHALGLPWEEPEV